MTTDPNASPRGDGPVRTGFIAVYAIAYASLWLALLTPATVTLALRVRQIAPDDATRAVSSVLFAGALVALVSNPIFGALSDRTRSRLGRRRPYLLVGAAAGLAALWMIGIASGLTLVVLGWCLAQLSYNAVLAALVAVVADEIPAARRGTVVGVLGMCMPLGQIAGTFLVQHLAFDLLLALLVPGVIGLVGVWALALSLPASRPAECSGEGARAASVSSDAAGALRSIGAAGPGRSAEASRSVGAGSSAARSSAGAGSSAEAGRSAGAAPAEAGVGVGVGVRSRGANDVGMTANSVSSGPGGIARLLGRLARHRDFSWAWSSRVFFVVGHVSFQAYQPFLLLDALGFDAAQVPRLIFGSTLVHAAVTVLSSLLAGRLSDRWGRRKPVATVGAVLQGVGLWLVAVADSYTGLLCGVAVAGIGYGAYEGVDLALVTDVLPDRDHHAAKDLGLLNIANALPQVIAPLAAPTILATSHGNYTLLFLIAGAIPVLGAALLLPMKGAR